MSPNSMLTGTHLSAGFNFVKEEENRTMRKISVTLGLIFLSLTIILAGCGPQTGNTQSSSDGKKLLKVGVSQFVAHPALDLDQKGFLDRMKELGFVQGQNVEFDIKNSQGDPNMAKTIADKFVADKADVILSITTPSSQAAAMATKGTGIPVVYIAVSDAVGSGLIKELNKPTGTNITGVYSADPVEQQMNLIKEIQPAIKNLGVLYNAGEANSVSNVKRIKEYLKGKVNVVEATVASSNEVQAAAQSLAGRVDAMFMPQDNTVMSAVESVISVGQTNKIPFYTGDTESVKKGALATLGNDEYDCGRQGAELVAKILKGEKAGNIPSEEIRKRSLLINKGVAEKYGITIPESVLSRADQVL